MSPVSLGLDGGGGGGGAWLIPQTHHRVCHNGHWDYEIRILSSPHVLLLSWVTSIVMEIYRDVLEDYEDADIVLRQSSSYNHFGNGRTELREVNEVIRFLNIFL